MTTYNNNFTHDLEFGNMGEKSIAKILELEHNKFEVKTDKGWQSPILKPHYDSGWTSVVKDATYKFKHHLGSKILFIQIFFKISTGEVIHMGHYGLHEMRNSPTNEDNGITVQMTSNSGLDIGTATYGIVATDNIPYESGHLRVLLWKTGVKA